MVNRCRRRRPHWDEVSVEHRPRCHRAVYLIEACTDKDASSVQSLLSDLCPRVQSVQLSSGRIVSYAVAVNHGEQFLLDQIEDFLKSHFAFVMQERSLDECIFQVVACLCEDSQSDLLSICTCATCGKPEPFPETVVTLVDRRSRTMAERAYCTGCAAKAFSRTGRVLVA